MYFSMQTPMLVVEFHCHTDASSDSLIRPADLIRAARRKGIDRLIVTDHNSIRGARAAQSLDPELIIVGEEILTTRGEILAAFVQEEIPPMLTPQETIRRLKEQGAFISVSHPFDSMRKGGWREADLLEIIRDVDAIEIYNSRCIFPHFNWQARQFALRHGLAGTAGSDAHALFEVGRSVMMLQPFEDADGLRKVVRGARFKVQWSPPWFHLSSRYASLIRRLKS